MIAPSAGVQILVASHPVDFRKSADRLAAINQLREDCSVVNSPRRSRQARPGYLASLVKRLSPVQSRERLNGLHPRLCCLGLPGVFPFYKEEAPQFTAPLAIAVGKNWMHRGNANFAKEITPVVCPEAQQNPSHPVISESYRGSEHALPDPKNCMVAARANVGFHKY